MYIKETCKAKDKVIISLNAMTGENNKTSTGMFSLPQILDLT